jgi:hypothetical protein
MTVDLGSTYVIDQIIIRSRRDCCSGRVIGSKVEIRDSAQNVIFTSNILKGKDGQTELTEGMVAFPVYTITPPSSVVVGSN